MSIIHLSDGEPADVDPFYDPADDEPDAHDDGLGGFVATPEQRREYRAWFAEYYDPAVPLADAEWERER